MDSTAPEPQRAPAWLNATSGVFETFRTITGQTTDPKTTPLAGEIIRNIPVYDGAMVDAAAENPPARQSLLEEWAHVFGHGAGIIVIRH